MLSSVAARMMRTAISARLAAITFLKGGRPPRGSSEPPSKTGSMSEASLTYIRASSTPMRTAGVGAGRLTVSGRPTPRSEAASAEPPSQAARSSTTRRAIATEKVSPSRIDDGSAADGHVFLSRFRKSHLYAFLFPGYLSQRAAGGAWVLSESHSLTHSLTYSLTSITHSHLT